jgi:hypothetical protein
MSNYPSASSVVALSNAASQAATVTGAAVNLMTLDFDGQIEVTQNIGAVTGSITGKLQESADGSTGWTDIAGATFTAVSAANNVQRLTLVAHSTAGYIRYVGTIVTGPALVSVVAGGVPKNVG